MEIKRVSKLTSFLERDNLQPPVDVMIKDYTCTFQIS